MSVTAMRVPSTRALASSALHSTAVIRRPPRPRASCARPSREARADAGSSRAHLHPLGGDHAGVAVELGRHSRHAPHRHMQRSYASMRPFSSSTVFAEASTDFAPLVTHSAPSSVTNAGVVEYELIGLARAARHFVRERDVRMACAGIDHRHLARRERRPCDANIRAGIRARRMNSRGARCAGGRYATGVRASVLGSGVQGRAAVSRARRYNSTALFARGALAPPRGTTCPPAATRRKK